ncbi:DNA cytosine methyltransferase [Methylotenera sp. 1P/1]|uniref:DNA cytosine methyltransferase n=1 Tax=Methylotenera sp. 1P/1 TaxID=1131551 RepID=UPI0003774CFF|nr:DNA cytosine methyltransferase [Methylotenera sp. 1P/1]
MRQKKPIIVVDLFAGPGGLSEGFSSLKNSNAFKILVSAEMETSAHATLTLRAFYRILKKKGSSALDSYYSFCNGKTNLPYNDENLDEWNEAKSEARQIKLGSEEGNQELNLILDSANIRDGVTCSPLAIPI